MLLDVSWRQYNHFCPMPDKQNFWTISNLQTHIDYETQGIFILHLKTWLYQLRYYDMQTAIMHTDCFLLISHYNLECSWNEHCHSYNQRKRERLPNEDTSSCVFPISSPSQRYANGTAAIGDLSSVLSSF